MGRILLSLPLQARILDLSQGGGGGGSTMSGPKGPRETLISRFYRSVLISEI